MGFWTVEVALLSIAALGGLIALLASRPRLVWMCCGVVWVLGAVAGAIYGCVGNHSVITCGAIGLWYVAGNRLLFRRSASGKRDEPIFMRRRA